jgi:predicted nucleotidyltransferase
MAREQKTTLRHAPAGGAHLSPSPLVGEGGVGGTRARRRKPTPPTLTLPHKGGGNKAASLSASARPFRRRLGLVPQAAIRRLAQEIAEKFRPERIILFGSYAYGRPNPDSDVDLLVVMPASNEIGKAARIHQSVDTPFPVDLLVRTPERLKRRLAWGDWFLREIVTQGQVLYETIDDRMGE